MSKIQKLIIILVILIILITLNNNKQNFGLTPTTAVISTIENPILPDFSISKYGKTYYDINDVQNMLNKFPIIGKSNKSNKFNIILIPNTTTVVDANLYQVVYHQYPRDGSRMTYDMTITFYYYSILGSLIGNNDNIDFFNINTKITNKNIISLNKINNVPQSIKSSNNNDFLNLKNNYLSYSDKFYISSIYTDFIKKTYDNIFFFVKSDGETQVVGIINSTKTKDILWRDLTFSRSSSDTTNPFYLKLESTGEVNGYFYDYNDLNNKVNLFNYDKVYNNNIIISQPNLQTVLNKNIIDPLNVLSQNKNFSRLSSLSNGNCSLKLNNKGDLVFEDSSNSNNNKIIVNSNKQVGYKGNFMFILTDEGANCCMRIYELNGDKIGNNGNPVGEINLLYKNYLFQDINPKNMNINNNTTIPLSYIMNKPYFLAIINNTLILSFIQKNNNKRITIPLTK